MIEQIILLALVLFFFVLIFIVPIFSLILNDNKKYIKMKRERKWNNLINKLKFPYEQEFWCELMRLTKSCRDDAIKKVYYGDLANNIREYKIGKKFSIYNIKELECYSITVYGDKEQTIYMQDEISFQLYDMLFDYILERIDEREKICEEMKKKSSRIEYKNDIRKAYYKLIGLE